INVTLRFTTTGGNTIEKSKEVSVFIQGNRRPVFDHNFSLVSQEGFKGNLIPPDDVFNNSVTNQGTSKAFSVGWNVSDGRIKSWINSWKPAKTASSRSNGFPKDLASGSQLGIAKLNLKIPEGTPPGNYTTVMETTSEDPTKTDEADLKVRIKNNPSFEIKLERIKSDVTIPSREINYSNPIDLGVLETGASNKPIFNITLNNTGNRDLMWKLKSTQGTGDLDKNFYFNASDPGSPYGFPSRFGVERFYSNITSEPNFTYNIPDREGHLLYSLPPDANSGIYRANMTISCTYPIGGSKVCENGTITLPMKGNIADPKPSFSQLQVPNITGVNKKIYFSGEASDNREVSDVNITLRKNLDGSTVVERISNVALSLTNSFNKSFEPVKEFDQGSEDNQEPDNYSVVFKVSDDAGQVSDSRKFFMKV
ncbi:MAG: hypothetical protein ABEK04_05395, partial [Candidatus Nanohalobium sp.]